MIDRAQPEPQTEAQIRLAAVLRIMFANFDVMVQDSSWHAWYLGQVAGDAEAPSEVRAVAEFALRYHAGGIEKAITPVQHSAVPAGVPVNVGIPHAVAESIRPGLLVGLTDAKYVGGQMVIEGVAAIKNSEDNWAFVNVGLRAGGETVLLPEDQQINNPDTWILLMDLKLGVGR